MTIFIQESLAQLIPFVPSLSNRKRNQRFSVRPELVEGVAQSLLRSVRLRHSRN